MNMYFHFLASFLATFIFLRTIFKVVSKYIKANSDKEYRRKFRLKFIDACQNGAARCRDSLFIRVLLQYHGFAIFMTIFWIALGVFIYEYSNTALTVLYVCAILIRVKNMINGMLGIRYYIKHPEYNPMLKSYNS
jgi:hypothetical protein